jgi:hypothetical protein
MNKRGLALSSLVMSIPAGILLYLLVRTILDYSESMPTMLTIIVWTLILFSLLMVISPLIFLIAGPKAAVALPGGAGMAPVPLAEEPKKKPAKKAAEIADEFSSDDDIAADEDSLSADDEQLFDTSEDEAGADEFEDSFNFDDDDDAFADEEEEPAPKKKKKK